MINRRQLEFGEKIVFQTLIGDNVNAIVLCQTGQEVAVQISRSEPHINIHRLQVRKTFKKVKKKPPILWTNKFQEAFIKSNLVKDHEGLFWKVQKHEEDIPYRPLTAKERKKWGV